ncbi:hypothetical protein SLA2020_119580 [Shorea laevis]
MFRASAPSGDGTGMYEAIDLRDGDKGSYLGNSVTKAVKNINEKISEALIGMDPTLQSQIDQAMIDLDKTEKKSELGANAILAVSIAACKAGAAEKEVLILVNIVFESSQHENRDPLYKHIADLYGKSNSIIPVPVFSVISGGKPAGNSLAFQDIMILPTGASRFEEALQMGSETYHHLKAVVTERYGASGCNVGEVGGLAPNISSVREGLDLVKEGISRTGFNDRIKIAIDVAATEFCIGTKYDLEIKSPSRSGQNFKSGEDMIQMYKELCGDYPIVSIEDPFDKEDREHNKFFCALGLCQESACNSLILKINQIGTLTQAIEVVKLAKEAHWGVVTSHRWGETEDSFIADLDVGHGACQIKASAPCRGERLAKYNQVFFSDQALFAFFLDFILCNSMPTTTGAFQRPD